MSRDAFSPLLHDLLDGDLAPEDRRRLDAHLATCQRCRAELEELTSLEGALSSAMPARPPAGASTRVADAVWQRRSSRENVPLPLLVLAAAALAGILVAGAGLLKSTSLSAAGELLSGLADLEAPSLDGLASLLSGGSEAVLGALRQIPPGLLVPIALGLVSLQLLGSLALARRRAA